MWRFIFVSSVEIAEIFSLFLLAAAAITHICTNENGQTGTCKTLLAFWQKWADEMIRESSHWGHHFQGQLSISRHRLSGRAIRSHSSDNGMDAKLKTDVFFLFRKCYSAWMVQEKSHSHSAEQWWKCHHLLSLNLTWDDLTKMVACPAAWWAALFWKACRGSIFHNLLPQCRSRRCPSRTSSGIHLHSWPFPGCNPTTCRSDLLWWIQPLKQKHLTSTDVGDKWRLLSPESWPLGTLL